MTIRELHELTGKLLADHGDTDVAINYDTFMESDNGNILTVESGELLQAQGADDSGPVGDEFPFLVLKGGVEWHAHGDPIQVQL